MALPWFALAMLIVIVAGLALRYGTNILDYPDVRDELLMKRPIDGIVQSGWNVDTAINYQEVKGPAFFWPYAAGAQMIGNEMNDLRLISMLFFIGGAIPLLLIAMRCGARSWMLALIALLYVLLPYNAWVAQMLMSEPSFNFFGLWMMWAFVWGLTSESVVVRRCALALFTLLLSTLLHHRPQGIALAGAAALVAFERDGLRSWPWIAACMIAGLSRLPLWLHWGGLVTSDYQGLFAFGFRLDPMTYLLAAALPFTAAFLWPVFSELRYRSWRWWMIGGGVAGTLFGFLFPPDLFARVEYQLLSMEAAATQPIYMGVIATGVKLMLPGGKVQLLIIAALTGTGVMSLIAMLAVTWSRSALLGEGAVCRLGFWMLAAGLPLYTITAGPVYDRYLAVWVVLLPIIWARTLPRGAVLAQLALMSAMFVYFVFENLM